MELAVEHNRIWGCFARLASVFAAAGASDARSGAETAGAPSRMDANRVAEHLLDAWGNSILRLAYSYLHNRQDAEEVVQDTLVQYLKEAPAFRDAVHEKARSIPRNGPSPSTASR